MSERNGDENDVLCDGIIPSPRVLELEVQTQWTWYKLPRWVFRGRKMTPAEKVLLFTILDFWNSLGCPMGWFHAPFRMLERWAGMSKTTIQRARIGLVEKCFIDFRAAPRRLAARHHLSSEYSISSDIIERLIKLQPLKTSTLVGSLKVNRGLGSF